jgi:hypothetical protein
MDQVRSAPELLTPEWLILQKGSEGFGEKNKRCRRLTKIRRMAEKEHENEN